MIEANYDKVICPNCVTQFRAIPVNVQDQITALTAERDIAVRKLAALSNAHALEDLYLVGLVQEREITLLTKEHDVLTVANRDMQDWFDALKTDHDALKDAARLALDALYAYEPCIKKFGLLFGTGNKAIAALKAVL